MTTITDEPANALNSAEKMIQVNGQALANLFSKIKKNEKINDDIEIKVDREPKDIPRPELNDFAEQMVYFRKRLGYTQKQAGKAIGVSEDTYRRYELKEIEIIDLKKIDKIVKALEFTEKPKVSEYVEFLMSHPDKMLVKFFEESGMSKNAFAREAGFNRRSISEESYYKIKRFMEKYEEEKEYQEKIIEEDEEME